jgi:hypothetical protein
MRIKNIAAAPPGPAWRSPIAGYSEISSDSNYMPVNNGCYPTA